MALSNLKKELKYCEKAIEALNSAEHELVARFNPLTALSSINKAQKQLEKLVLSIEADILDARELLGDLKGDDE